MDERFYKIRNRSGCYSAGGMSSYDRWRKKGGKVWKSLVHLRRHLLELQSHRQSDYPAGCVVEIYEWKHVETKPLTELIQAAANRRLELDQRYARSRRNAEERREREQLARLKAKYEG